MNLVTIQRLRDEFAERPREANLRAAHERGWTLFSRPVAFPEPYNRRTFVGESYVLLDLNDAGLAAGCRPLRPSAAPQLDAFACALLMRPGWFSATFVPQRESLAGRWVMGLRWESLPASAHRAREAGAPRPSITAPPPPPAPRAAPRPSQPEPPSQGPRRGISGSLLADDYGGIADLQIREGQFEAELSVNEDGVTTGCRVTRSTGNDAVDARTCALLVRRARFTRRVDASGRLIADTVTQPVDVGWMLHGWRRPPPR